MYRIYSLLFLGLAVSIISGCAGAKPDAQYSSLCHSQKTLILSSQLDNQPGQINPATRASMIREHQKNCR